MKSKTVLSLFNGMNGGRLALEGSNIPVKKYYASEVDKYAMQVADALYPDTVNVGDVRNVDVSKLDHIDVLIGGSPCQSFSFAGKQKGMVTTTEIKITTLEKYLELKEEGFEFEGQSYLFWEYIRILTDIRKYNPDVLFFLENVVMTKDWEIILTKAIGIEPVKINSALVSAQNRKRLYWSNIKTTTFGLWGNTVQDIPQPKDRGILLKDVLEREVNEKYYIDSSKYEQQYDDVLKIDKGGSPKANQNKAGCLTAGGHSGGNHSDMDLIVECVAMRGGNPENPENPKSRESGLDTVQMIEPRSDGKTNCLTTVQKDNMVKETNTQTRIRRLTPRECSRLQTVPEDKIDIMLNCGVSDSQIYKMLGNGWTIEVIAHFFKEIK